jgi:hypothetical protein
MNRRTFLQAVAVVPAALAIPFAIKPAAIPPRHEWHRIVVCRQAHDKREHDITECQFECPSIPRMTLWSVHFQGHEAVFDFKPIVEYGVIPYDKIGRSGK